MSTHQPPHGNEEEPRIPGADPFRPGGEGFPRDSGPFAPIGRDPFRAGTVPGNQPGPAKALGWLTLATGIWCVLFSATSIFAWGACCLFILPAFQFVTGIVGIVHGARMVSDDQASPSGGLIVAYIVCIVNFDVVSLISGIVQSVLRGDERVRAWYRDY